MKVTTEGYWTRRLAPEQGNPREVAFAEQWAREHEHHDLLAILLAESPTEEERHAVATVIQWLGSNVGMSFLREALERCGMRIESK